MKFLVQRVSEAKVEVSGETIGRIGRGLLVFIGICDTDTEEIADRMVRKLTALRIFEDENGKTNLSLASVSGGLLLISQFTLYADCRSGSRPSFIRAGAPEPAKALYEEIIEKCRQVIPETEHGCFGADMKVSLINDGPFTVMLDSEELISGRNGK